MDIFRFIDSADIRRYLVEIQYRFSTEEKMFLIWYCKTATLNEKIAAWQEIVGYVPSCPWDDAWDIRERVAAYIELQEEMLGQFQSADSCVYQYKLIDSLTGETDSGSVYRSYKDCLAAAIHAAHAAGCCKLEIRKEPLNAAEHSRRIGTCLFNQDGEIMQINCLPTDAEDMMTYLLFEEMWFAWSRMTCWTGRTPLRRRPGGMPTLRRQWALCSGTIPTRPSKNGWRNKQWRQVYHLPPYAFYWGWEKSKSCPISQSTFPKAGSLWSFSDRGFINLYSPDSSPV